MARNEMINCWSKINWINGDDNYGSTSIALRGGTQLWYNIPKFGQMETSIIHSISLPHTQTQIASFTDVVHGRPRVT